MKKKLLIITQSQFGSLIDYYQYSLNLKEKYEIEYICWDYKRPKIYIDGIKVFYVSRNGNILKRNLRFINFIFMKIKLKSYSRILVNYFRGSFILPFIVKNKNEIFLDIRTAGVQEYLINRFFYNAFLRFECIFYYNLSVISLGVKQNLYLPKNTVVIPLGANYIDVKRSYMEGLNLLYVGTLSNRNLEETLEGIYLFLNNYKNVNLSYTIIGLGDKKSTDKLNKTIEIYKLKDVVKLVGYIPPGKLITYFKESNIGVSYVPMTNYFNYQPVTKTFEYLMSGLPVIATSTYENKLIINYTNGVLVNDNPISFYYGLCQINELLQSYNDISIKLDLSDYQWKNISLKLENFLFNN